jgi:hypothetical protein
MGKFDKYGRILCRVVFKQGMNSPDIDLSETLISRNLVF